MQLEQVKEVPIIGKPGMGYAEASHSQVWHWQGGQLSCPDSYSSFSASTCLMLCLQVKERLKSSKQEKAALRSADAKRGGSKATKNVPGARAPGAKSGTRR